MRKNIFEEELNRRGNADENAYNMIGTELKRVRTSQSQTLSSVASDVCSVSYLCKIENAQLKPNRQMLQEICKKLNMAEPKIALLFDLKRLLFEMIEAFYKKDKKNMERIFNQCKVLDNYRSKLIELIYFISCYNLDKANSISLGLMKITNLMNNDELIALMVFHSILCYYQENFLEALDNLKCMEEQTVSGTLLKIGKLFCFQCYLKLNSPITLVYGQQLMELFLNGSEFSYADYIRYLLILYLIKNGMQDRAIKELDVLLSPTFKKSIQLILDYQQHQLKDAQYYDTLRPFAKLLFVYVFHRKSYLNYFLKTDKNHFFACDFSYNIASYLSFEDERDKLNEIVEVIIPNLCHTSNFFEREYFLKELCRMSFKFGRYKSFCKSYELLMKGVN